MELSYIDFIKIAEERFKDFHIVYNELELALSENNDEAFTKAKLKWYNDNGFESPLKDIINGLQDYDDTGAGLWKPIKKYLLENQLGFIEYTKVVIKRQQDFVKKKFPDVEKFYQKNPDDVEDLFFGLYEMIYALTDDELLKALQLYFFECLSYLQTEFYEAYPLFKKKFFKSNGKLAAHHRIGNYIRMEYPENKIDVVIKTIFNGLHGEFISETPKQFKKHFRPFAARKKMVWHRSATLLMLLFEGKNIQVGDEFKFDGLKLSSKNVVKLAQDHFIKPDNDEWSDDELYKALNRVRKDDVIHKDGDAMFQIFENVREVIK